MTDEIVCRAHHKHRSLQWVSIFHAHCTISFPTFRRLISHSLIRPIAFFLKTFFFKSEVGSPRLSHLLYVFRACRWLFNVNFPALVQHVSRLWDRRLLVDKVADYQLGHLCTHVPQFVYKDTDNQTKLWYILHSIF